MKYISFAIAIMLHIASIQGQTPYNAKIYGFQKQIVEIEAFQEIDSKGFGFMGVFLDTAGADPGFLKSNSILGVLNKNLELTCFTDVLPDEINKSTWFISDITKISQDSFLACGQSVEWNSSNVITSHSLYLISFNKQCQYTSLKEIYMPHDRTKRELGVVNVQRDLDSNFYYISYFTEFSKTGYEACVLKLSEQLDIVWNECYTSKDYNSEFTNLTPQKPLIIADSNTMILPVIRSTSYSSGAYNKLSQLQFIYIDNVNGDEIERYSTDENYHLYPKQCIWDSKNGFVYSTLGIDTVFYPWGCCPDKEYVANKHSIGKIDLKGDIIFNKAVGDSLWEWDWGFNDIIKSNDEDGLILVGNKWGQFNLPDSSTGRGGIIVKSDLSGDEIWRRNFSYNPYAYNANYSLDNIEKSRDMDGYIISGQIYLYDAPPDSMHTIAPSIIFYIDEYGCMIPGCETVNQTSIQTGRVSLLTYPNPASDYLYIYIPTIDEITSQNSIYLHINDISGNLIYSDKVKVSDNTLIIETGNWSNGIYIASLTKNGHTIASEKVVVQR